MNVVITGASAGIGRAYVKTFSRYGHNVLAIARREERLKALSEDMENLYAAEVHILSVDLTSVGASQAVFDRSVKVFGKVHMLINNAGMSPYQAFQDLELCHLQQTIALNIQSLTELCHKFIPHMLDHGEPSHVVNVGSAGGYAPLPYFAVYTGSKHYVRIFSNILRHEYRDSNVKVSAVHPGGVLTEFAELAGQRIKEPTKKAMMTAEEMAEKTYPAIIKGRRVIVPGGIYKISVILGKLLPFPLMIRIMNLIYHQGMDKVDPTYPIPASMEPNQEIDREDQ